VQPLDTKRPRGRATALGAGVGAAYLLSSAYLAVEASPSLFYVANIFAHAFGGLLLAVVFGVGAVRGLRAARCAGGAAFPIGILSFVLLVASVVAAAALFVLHHTRATKWILDLHIALAVPGTACALLACVLYARRAGSPALAAGLRILGASAALGIAMVLAWAPLVTQPRREAQRIENPGRPPFEMAEEAMGGAEGPFFPSSAATSTGGRIPSNFFMTSEACARCHQDIFDAWNVSAHHFSSFNNQWYRRSIEYMQEVNSVQSSKWCAGCHDHAVLLNGMMDEPVATFLDTQEAHTGVGCNSCHAITGVQSTMGQGAFFLEYPPLHDLAVSEDPLLRWFHDTALRLDPGPHRDVFLKPFHREQTSEFCASCHKVHLDVPVNNYRWIRGFNEYDNWQASGVSGQGARSFYYPPEPRDCADCHMPTVRSDDRGNIDGYVHDHSFVAANTALPVANLHEDQMRRTIEFLQANQVTVDVFAAGTPREREAMETVTGGDEMRAASTFGEGEEVAMAVGRGTGMSREPEAIWAPLDRADVAVRRGEEIRVDVVVRTRGVGHFFPGGTVDAFDTWLEVRATDETGRTVYWSGAATEGGTGPVDEGAHRYGARMVDGHGNRIDRRNAWATRAVAWVNLIPPGAADVAHFRMRIPEDCGDSLRVEARLNYRKFSHANTTFSFAGQAAAYEPAPGAGTDRVTPHYDDRDFVLGAVPMNVSAELREIPDLPIVVMSRAEAKLRVVTAGTSVENVCPEPKAGEALRWNDYGIGLLLRGDLQGARRAFTRVAQADPSYADAFVNLGRVALREGLLDDAHAALTEALALDADLPRTHYFLGVVAKSRGEYDEALARLRTAAAAYPKDRVVRNDIGRVLFLQRRYEEAVIELQRVLEIDPEDLAAHYNLMLCYKGLGLEEAAAAEERLYLRFKADEDAPMLLGPYLRENPGDNRMRQLLHEQTSMSEDAIRREIAIRERAGEPNVVMPGQAAEYAKRMVERGARLLAEGRGAERVDGPVEAAFVDPVATE
jgi:tetratricopeptide (TPR) repeat protein